MSETREQTPEQYWESIKQMARDELDDRVTNYGDGWASDPDVTDEVNEIADSMTPIYNYDRAKLASIPEVWANETAGELASGRSSLMDMIGLYICCALCDDLYWYADEQIKSAEDEEEDWPLVPPPGHSDD